MVYSPEALHVRKRERAIAVCRAAEPGISRTQGQINDLCIVVAEEILPAPIGAE